YQLRITTDLADRNGIPLAVAFVSRFHTLPLSTVALASAWPPVAIVGGLLTLNGSGFDLTAPSLNRVLFTACGGCPSDTVSAMSVTPGSITVPIPTWAVSGNVRAFALGGASNALPITIGADPTISPATPLGAGVALHGSP